MSDHISILGICCARDIFGMQKEDGGYDKEIYDLIKLKQDIEKQMEEKNGTLLEV